MPSYVPPLRDMRFVLHEVLEQKRKAFGDRVVAEMPELERQPSLD